MIIKKMTTQPFCVIGCNYGPEHVNLFTEEKLKRFHEILGIRQKLDLKYADLSIPDSVTDVHGYHSCCAKIFLSITKKTLYRYYDMQNPTSDSKEISKNTDRKTKASRPPKVLKTSLTVQETESSQPENANQESAFSYESDSDEWTPTDAGNVGQICLFCKQTQKRINYKTQKIVGSSDGKLYDDILKHAIDVEDEDMLEILNIIDPDDRIYYHNNCKLSYFYSDRKKNRKSKRTDWHETREINESAYKIVCDLIQKNIIDEKNCLSLKFLMNIYVETLNKMFINIPGPVHRILNRHDLWAKLSRTYRDNIQIVIIGDKRLVFPKDGWIITDETLPTLEEYEKDYLKDYKSKLVNNPPDIASKIK